MDGASLKSRMRVDRRHGARLHIEITTERQTTEPEFGEPLGNVMDAGLEILGVA